MKQNFKTIYNYKQNDGVKFNTPSMTQQQFKDEELDELYKICMKNDDFQEKVLPFQYNN